MTLPDPDGAGSQPAPVSTFAYDAAGRLIGSARTDVQALAAAQPPLEQASYAYDGLGRLVARADFRGTLTSTYDAGVRLTATTDRLGRVTSYAYDALDRPTRVTAPDPDGNPATSNTPVWAFAYDAAGQQRLAIDPAGARTATAYDDAGAVALVRDPVGSATRFARDAVGNLIRVTDPLGNTTTTTFDALDRPVREQVGFTAADRTFAYDPAGNLDRVKDRNGRVIDFDSDNLGRTVAEKWLPAGGTTPIRTLTSTYTATGQLQGVVDTDVVDSSFTYDALDRPVTETTSLHGPVAPTTPFSFTLTATYDAADRRTGLADSRGGLATYGYDGAGRMTSASLGAGGVAGPAVTLGYDANDRLTDLGRRVGTAGRSILSRLNYDAAGRLIRVEHADSADTAWGGDTPLASFEDTLDAAGRVTSTIGTSKTGITETRSYGYDAAGQIVSQAVTGQATTAFAYDAAGNRTAGTTIQGGNRLAEDATYRYAYDAEGNLTRREEKSSTRVREYAWDHRNRLTGVTDRDTATGPATQQVSFVYDAFDRRVGKIVDADGAGPQAATKRWTMYDGQDAYADLDAAGAVQSRYLHGPAVDLLLARLDADTTSTWYLPDRLGSTRALARIGASSAQVLDRLDYDAFGTASESSPTAGDRFKFTGREYDAETGLYYYRARYYDAGTGRFVGEDPSGFAGGDANLYRYVGNSPTNLVDPSGLKAAVADPGGGRVSGWHTELAGHVIASDARGPGPSLYDELGVLWNHPRYLVLAPTAVVIQVGANAINGLQDSLVALPNIGICLANLCRTHKNQISYLDSPDWSYGAANRVMASAGSDFAYEEGRTEHEVSKFVGGMLLTFLIPGSVAVPRNLGMRLPTPSLQPAGFPALSVSLATPHGASVSARGLAAVTMGVGEAGHLWFAYSESAGGPGNGPVAPNAVRPSVSTSLPGRVTGELPPGTGRTSAELKQARNFFERNRDAARNWWEQRTGRQWPDNATHYEHPRPIKDGGDPLFVEPGFNGPNSPHMVPGPNGLTDFQRWGQMGGRPKAK